MKFTGKIMVAATGVALMVGSIAMVGTGIASAKGKATGTGTVTCSTVSGILKFSPPLATNGTTSGTEVTTFKGKLSNCTGGTPTPSKGAVVSETSTTNNGNACSGFSTSVTKSSTTFTIKWKGAINPTTVTYPAGDITVTGGGTGFQLGGKGVTGSGSYPGSDSWASSTAAATANINLANGLCPNGKPQKVIKILSGKDVVG